MSQEQNNASPLEEEGKQRDKQDSPKPEPGRQGRLVQPTKIERSSEGHVAFVAVVGPPLGAATVGVVGHHPHL